MIERIGPLSLVIIDPKEILGMGGPFIADVKIDDKLIATDVIADNFLYQNETNCLYYVQYHEIQSYTYFTINFCNMNDHSHYQFDREFDMLYINAFIDKYELEIFYAFHNKLANRRDIFNMDAEGFNKIFTNPNSL